ncbi:unnamed protein product [Sphagnum balticum]
MTVLMLDCQVDSVVPSVLVQWLSGGVAILAQRVRGRCKLHWHRMVPPFDFTKRAMKHRLLTSSRKRGTARKETGRAFRCVRFARTQSSHVDIVTRKMVA